MKVDCREPKEYRNLFPNVEIVKLVVGDYTNDTIVVERKKANDFVSSILDQRLWRQLDNLSQSRAVLLIEGNLEGAIKAHSKRSNRSYQTLWNIVYGAYASLVARENYKNIKIAHVQNKSELKYVILKLFEKCDYKHRVINRPKSPNTALNILVGFPGISVVRAIKLLQKYETAKNAIEHMDEWKLVVGNAVSVRCVDAYRSQLKR